MSGKLASHRSKAACNRADLLWGFFAVDETQYPDLAELLGFEHTGTPDIERERATLPSPEAITVASDASWQDSDAKNATASPKSTATSSSYYRIVERQLDATRPGVETPELTVPEWFTQASPTILKDEESRIPPIHQVAPRYIPLTPWSRLWPLLQRVLGDRISGNQPDMPELVKQVADQAFIRQIPRKQRQGWAAAALILIDINDHNFPYRRDFIHLRERLIDARGDEGLEIQYIHDEPGGYIARYAYGREIVQPWQWPEKGTSILILSDMGMQAGSRRELYAWLLFGQLLQAQGFRPTVLMPVAERNLDKRLLQYFDCILWDRISRLKRVKGLYQPERDKRNHTETIDQLLCYFFAAVRVDMGLLRAVRQLLPAREYDIGHEALLWQHPTVNREGDEWGWQASSKPRYLNDARTQLKKLERAQQKRLVELIGHYHAQYPDELYFEAMHSLMLLGLHLPDEVQDATDKFMQDMVATYAQHPENTLLDGWVKRHLARYEDLAIREHHHYWPPFLAFARVHEAKRKGMAEIEMPESLSAHEKTEVLRYVNHVRKPETYVLRQQGEVLALLPQQDAIETSQTDEWGKNASMGANLLTLHLKDTHIFHAHHERKGRQRDVMLDLAAPGKNSFRFPATGRHEFQIGRERFGVEVKSAQQLKEPWMRRVTAGSGGLWAESRSGGEYYWHPPEWHPGSGIMRGIWYPSNSIDRQTAPWAERMGRDAYGVYADTAIAGGMTQRFRWIEPASFQMGSPAGEGGRYDNETQHEVILTQGYWLADTACTQALWQTVTGENSSEFKGENNPFENVSWEDIDQFLQRLNQQYPELKLRLPSEAEWENACRSGTTGAFNFDGALSLDKVNYRGTWDDYEKWGEGALQQTAAVKSYPPNSWGLYEMHGNVWEWCQDWYGDYPVGPVVDPQGAQSGPYRVLRGGSWFGNGRYCRSAYRYHDDPAYRGFIGDDFGFRLARGLELPVRPGASQQPLGTPAPERGGHKRGLDGGAVSENSETGQVIQPKKQKKWLRGMMDSIKNRLKK